MIEWDAEQAGPVLALAPPVFALSALASGWDAVSHEDRAVFCSYLKHGSVVHVAAPAAGLSLAAYNYARAVYPGGVPRLVRAFIVWLFVGFMAMQFSMHVPPEDFWVHTLLVTFTISCSIAVVASLSNPVHHRAGLAVAVACALAFNAGHYLRRGGQDGALARALIAGSGVLGMLAVSAYFLCASPTPRHEGPTRVWLALVLLPDVVHALLLWSRAHETVEHDAAPALAHGMCGAQR
jgi:hypothetical protein